MQAEATEASISKLCQRIQTAQEQEQHVREEVESLRRNVLARDAENRALQEAVSHLRQRRLVSPAVSQLSSCLSLCVV